MDTEDRLPEEWLEAARDYNRPPDETPAEAIWERVEAGLEGGRVLSLDQARERRAGGFRGGLTRWLGPAAAAAAVLALGVGIGRMTAPAGPGTGAVGPAAAVSPTSASPAFRLATLEHLGRTESLLALVRTDARTGRLDTEVGEWSRGLLAETRLLLDSPAADDPALRELLEDLELILAQVAVLDGGEGQVGEERQRAELDIIARGLEEHDVLSRIQAVLPGSGTGMTGI